MTKAYGIARAAFNQGYNASFNLSIEEEMSPTLTAKGPGAVCTEVIKNVQMYIAGGGQVIGTLCSSMAKGVQNQMISSDLGVIETMLWDGSQVCPTLSCRNAGGQQRMPDKMHFNAVIEKHKEQCMEEIKTRMVVRRLTPMECERLQGYPTVLEVNLKDMGKDEYIAYNLAAGNIIVDINRGRVFATRGTGGLLLDEPKELKGTILNGYIVHTIVNKDVRCQCRAHRIVWIAAHGIIPDGMIVDHINNKKTDNRLCNLQLLTHEENSTKATRDGCYNNKSKFDKDVIRQICDDYYHGETTIRKLAEKYGISKSRVHQIVHEYGWTEGQSDTQRYKQLGNSVAIPCVDYILEGIAQELSEGD